MAKRASRDELTFYLKSPIEISHYALFGDNLQGHRKILVTLITSVAPTKPSLENSGGLFRALMCYAMLLCND